MLKRMFRAVDGRVYITSVYNKDITESTGLHK